MRSKPVQPKLELNRIEYDIVAGLASKDGLTMSEYVESVIREKIEGFMVDKSNGNLQALPSLIVSNAEYAILQNLANEHEMTVTQLIRELVTPSGDKAARWVVLQVDHAAYKTFNAMYDNDDCAEAAMERYLKVEGERMAGMLKRTDIGRDGK